MYIIKAALIMRVKLSAVLTLGASATSSAGSDTVKIASLPQTRYDLQNSFLSSLFDSVGKSGAAIDFELITYDS